MDIFEASRKGDLSILKEHLTKNPDLSIVNEYGFTALHCAAMGSNSQDLPTNMEILKLLVEGGSPLEVPSKDGRTALYLLAEFSPYLESIKWLVGAGANPDVTSGYGNHITVNAMMEDVQEYLSEVTGVALEEEPEPGPEPVKMKTSAWKAAKKDIEKVFDKLNNAGLVALQDAGYTQSDGFEDCVEAYHKRKDKDSIKGFCFYTRQDQDRAKKSSELPLGIWGATEGGDKETIAVGQLVVSTFRDAGFHVIWPENASTRPSVYLHKYSE